MPDLEKKRKPEVIVFAGPNGSGKSTITRMAKTVGIYINAANVKENFTWCGKQSLTLFGKQFFTLFGKDNFTLSGKEFFHLLWVAVRQLSGKHIWVLQPVGLTAE